MCSTRNLRFSVRYVFRRSVRPYLAFTLFLLWSVYREEAHLLFTWQHCRCGLLFFFLFFLSFFPWTYFFVFFFPSFNRNRRLVVRSAKGWVGVEGREESRAGSGTDRCASLEWGLAGGGGWQTDRQIIAAGSTKEGER